MVGCYFYNGLDGSPYQTRSSGICRETRRGPFCFHFVDFILRTRLRAIERLPGQAQKRRRMLYTSERQSGGVLIPLTRCPLQHRASALVAQLDRARDS